MAEEEAPKPAEEAPAPAALVSASPVSEKATESPAEPAAAPAVASAEVAAETAAARAPAAPAEPVNKLHEWAAALGIMLFLALVLWVFLTFFRGATL